MRRLTNAPAGPDERREFEARLAALAAALGFVEEFCARQGVERMVALRMAFVVEELFTNTVNHGHRGDCDAPVEVGLARTAGALLLFYADTAPAYNPLTNFHGEPAGLAATLQMRPVGGLGAYAIGQLIETAGYEHRDGRNSLLLSLPIAT